MNDDMLTTVIQTIVKEDVYGTQVHPDYDPEVHIIDEFLETFKLFTKDDIVYFVIDTQVKEIYTLTSLGQVYIEEGVVIKDGKFNDEYADASFEIIRVIEGEGITTIEPELFMQLTRLYDERISYQINPHEDTVLKSY